MEVGPLRRRNIIKTKKAAVRRASSYLSDSSRLCSTPPRLSFSFLSAPPLLWGNRVDLYEIWSVSAKNKLTAQSVSSLTSLSLLCCNLHLVLPSFICISASYLHFHITLSCSLPLSSSQESIFNGFPSAFLVDTDPPPALSVYLCMMQLEGHTLWLKHARLWELHVCQQDVPAWQFSNLLPEIAFLAVRGPHSVGLAQIQEHVTVHVE